MEIQVDNYVDDGYWINHEGEAILLPIITPATMNTIGVVDIHKFRHDVRYDFPMKWARTTTVEQPHPKVTLLCNALRVNILFTVIRGEPLFHSVHQVPSCQRMPSQSDVLAR